MARLGRRIERDDARLEDRISLGVLAGAFPRHLVEEVVEAAGALEQRRRMLPAWLVVYYVLALALFTDVGGGRVMRKLAGTLAWASWDEGVELPSEEALSNARSRLGPEPLRLLFERVAGLRDGDDIAGVFWRGLRVVSLDGATLDLQDTEANWERFGGRSTTGAEGKKLRCGVPRMRVAALAECATRTVVAARIGAYSVGEETLTERLLGHLGPGMVVVADRDVLGCDLFQVAAGSGADLLWRVDASVHPHVDGALDDGSYLSRLKAPRALRRAAARDVAVRVIECRLGDSGGETSEPFRLVTTLLDPRSAPAGELVELYLVRWRIETALGVFKSDLRGGGVVLRSKTPDGAEQECWALLCVYHAVRRLI